jgi:hypothetical protein
MPSRVLQHGFAATTESAGLEPGTWADVSLHGQFLLDLEFLLRCAPTSGTASCLYCKSPPYLKEIAQQFPWIHFYAFEHTYPAPEYDPAQPLITTASQLTVQVDFNRTMSSDKFTKDMARTMGERCARDRESLLLICHGQDSMRQIALQVLMRPSYALLDVCCPIPAEYLEGDLILPIFLPNNKAFLCIVAKQHAKGRAYDSALLQTEIGQTRLHKKNISRFILTLCTNRLLPARPARHPVLRRGVQGRDSRRVRQIHAQVPQLPAGAGQGLPAQRRRHPVGV